MIVASIDSMSRALRTASMYSPVRSLRTFAFVATLTPLLFAVAQKSSAVPMNYGTFVGNTVTYVDVTEDSNSGDPLPLFGAPTVSGDSLDFNPVGFSATSMGVGSDITDANLAFMVTANPGFAISNFNLSEAGDTTLAGFGSDTTFTSVTADGVLNINEVDGMGINTLSIPIALSFVPSGGGFGLLTDGGGGPFYHTQWTGSLFVDIHAELAANNVPFTFGATKISINLDNTLTAVSEAGTQSLIAKKDFGGVSFTVNIPEPGTMTLVGFALVGLVIGGRRQSR